MCEKNVSSGKRETLNRFRYAMTHCNGEGDTKIKVQSNCFRCFEKLKKEKKSRKKSTYFGRLSKLLAFVSIGDKKTATKRLNIIF